MGTVLKYLSVVDKAFWGAEKLGPNGATDGMVSMTWDGTLGQPGERGCAARIFWRTLPRQFAENAGVIIASWLTVRN